MKPAQICLAWSGLCDHSAEGKSQDRRFIRGQSRP